MHWLNLFPLWPFFLYRASVMLSLLICLLLWVYVSICISFFQLLLYLNLNQILFYCFWLTPLSFVGYTLHKDSSFVPPLVYAVLGSSRDLAVGPVSIASLILGSMLRQEVSPSNDPLLFLQLAFSSTFFAGLFQASLGLLRWSLFSSSSSSSIYLSTPKKKVFSFP